MRAFQASGLPVLIGSLPLTDHDEATRLVIEHTPEIPLWVQLPIYPEEMMIPQFLPGLPGIEHDNEKMIVDSSDKSFDTELLAFYEEYLAVTGGDIDLFSSRFALTEDAAKGFTTLLKHLKMLEKPPVAVKGQITGPVTFATGIKDQNGRAIFYDEKIRDAAIKLLSQKAGWQVRKFSQLNCPVMIFIDEPALTGFGSSALIGIGRDEVSASLEEVIEGIHREGGLAGIHVCGNTDWSLLLESSVDIISFDAYAYFDRFILYSDQIKAFLGSDRILAWGIVPTLNTDDLEKENAESLTLKWKKYAQAVESLAVDASKIFAQSLITPSCGTGSLSLDHTKKVLKLTREVSDRITASN